MFKTKELFVKMNIKLKMLTFQLLGSVLSLLPIHESLAGYASYPPDLFNGYVLFEDSDNLKSAANCKHPLR